MTIAPAPASPPRTVAVRPPKPRVPYEGLFVQPVYTDGLPYERDDDEDGDGE